MRSVTFLLFATIAMPAAARPSNCALFEGASLVSSNGEYLGRITGENDADSVLNGSGKYGSNDSPTSIWNDAGQYGGTISSASPFSSLARNPPFLVRDGKKFGWLTSNALLPKAINPRILFLTCYNRKARS